MMWRIILTGGGSVKVYLARAATMKAAIGRALGSAYPGGAAPNPLNIGVEKAEEGLLLEESEDE